MKWATIIVVLFSTFTSFSFAADKVAKVLILKGTAKAKSPSGALTTLKRGAWIEEGSLLQTGEKSFVKLVFKDKSSANLGPKSQMAITKFPKNEAGVLTLLKGQLRSKVQKDLLKKDSKSKMFIKTKTAAMGVRGTDFEVIFNARTQNTAVITFEGEVAMAQIDPTQFESFQGNTQALEQIVSSDAAVSIKEGQFAGSNKSGRVNVPVKISPAQFNTLKGKEDPTIAGAKNKEVKRFQSPIPPGVNTKVFVNESVAVTESLAEVAGAAVVEQAVQVAETEIANAPPADAPPPEGFKDGSGNFAPPSGGLIDVRTGTYIAPPPGSTFDPNTQTYQPPPEFGGFDANTGDFLPPEGVVLTDDGQFAAEDQTTVTSTGEIVVAPGTNDPNRPAGSDPNAPAGQPGAGQPGPGQPGQPGPPRRGGVYIPQVVDIDTAGDFGESFTQSAGDFDSHVQGDFAHQPPPPGEFGPGPDGQDGPGFGPDGEPVDPCALDPNLCNIVDDIQQDVQQNNTATDNEQSSTVNFNISL